MLNTTVLGVLCVYKCTFKYCMLSCEVYNEHYNMSTNAHMNQVNFAYTGSFFFIGNPIPIAKSQFVRAIEYVQCVC